jgi:hypothetical protein
VATKPDDARGKQRAVGGDLHIHLYQEAGSLDLAVGNLSGNLEVAKFFRSRS